MGCNADDLAQAKRDLQAMTAERNQLLTIVRVTMELMTPEQFAEARRQIAERDPGSDNSV